MKNNVSDRFVNEKLKNHWIVDKSKESFEILIEHIKFKTNFYKGFIESVDNFLLTRNKKKLIIADLGAGVGWTSAYLAKNSRIEKIYIIEPSI